MTRRTRAVQCFGLDGKAPSTQPFEPSMKNKPKNSRVKVELPTKKDNNQQRSEPLMKRSQDFDRIEKENPLVKSPKKGRGK